MRTVVIISRIVPREKLFELFMQIYKWSNRSKVLSRLQLTLSMRPCRLPKKYWQPDYRRYHIVSFGIFESRTCSLPILLRYKDHQIWISSRSEDKFHHWVLFYSRSYYSVISLPYLPLISSTLNILTNYINNAAIINISTQISNGPTYVMINPSNNAPVTKEVFVCSGVIVVYGQTRLPSFNSFPHLWQNILFPY